MSSSPSSPSSSVDSRRRIIPGVSRRTDIPLDFRRCALVVIDIQRYLCPSSDKNEVVDKDSLTYYSDYYQQQFPQVFANIVELLNAFRSVRDGSATASVSSGTRTVDDDDAVATMTGSATGCEVIFTYLQSQTMDRRDISFDYKLSGPLLANIPTPRTNDDDLFLPTCCPHLPHGDHSSITTSKGDVRLPKTSCDVFVSTNLDYLLRQLDIRHLVFVGQFTEQCVESAVRHAADLGYVGVVISDACVCGSQAVHDDSLQRMRGYARVNTTADLLTELRRRGYRSLDEGSGQRSAAPCS